MEEGNRNGGLLETQWDGSSVCGKTARDMYLRCAIYPKDTICLLCKRDMRYAR